MSKFYVVYALKENPETHHYDLELPVPEEALEIVDANLRRANKREYPEISLDREVRSLLAEYQGSYTVPGLTDTGVYVLYGFIRAVYVQ